MKGIQLPVVIDRNSPVPLYYQLAEQLASYVYDGTLKPGDPFENELSLANRLELSRPTVRRAIMELVGRGLLARRRGVGTVVASTVIHRRDELTSLYDDLTREGHRPQTKVLQFDPAHIDAQAADALGSPSDQPLLYIKRLRSSDSVPLAVMQNWLPTQHASITPEALETDGLYSLLRKLGVAPALAHQTIGARPAYPEERRLLEMERSQPVLTLARTAFDSAGIALEYAEHSYRADHYALDLTVYAG